MKFIWSLPLLLSTLMMTAGPMFCSNRANAMNPASVNSSPLLQETAGDNQSDVDLTGSWQVSWTAPNGNQRQATLQLKQNGDKLTGTFEGERGSAAVKGNVKGSDISFEVKMPRRKVSFSGKVDGSQMSGTTERGTSWSATREATAQ